VGSIPICIKLRNDLGLVVHTSVAKQYNLILVEELRRSSAGKVTAGLRRKVMAAYRWGDLKVTCGLTACK